MPKITTNNKNAKNHKNPKITKDHQKCLKSQKLAKMPKMAERADFGRLLNPMTNFTLPEFFTQPAVVMVVTNIRYGNR